MTDNDKKVHQFIADYAKSQGVYPSYSEIAGHMGYSKPAAHKAVKRLVAAGVAVIDKSEHDWRSIRLVE